MHLTPTLNHSRPLSLTLMLTLTRLSTHTHPFTSTLTLTLSPSLTPTHTCHTLSPPSPSLTHSAPCHMQGLKDPEETVISKAVNAITGMCSLKLFDMPKLLEFVDHVLPLLFHPVRRAAMNGRATRIPSRTPLYGNMSCNKQ